MKFLKLNYFRKYYAYHMLIMAFKVIVTILLLTNLNFNCGFQSPETHSGRNISKLLEGKLQNIRDKAPTSDLVLVDYPFANEAVISKILQNFSRLRDFHTNPSVVVIVAVHLCNYLAQTMNASLVSTTGMKLGLPMGPEGFAGYPTISAFIMNKQVAQMQDKLFHAQSQSPQRSPVILIDSSSLNFVFCAGRRKQYDTVLSLLKALLGQADM